MLTNRLSLLAWTAKQIHLFLTPVRRYSVLGPPSQWFICQFVACILALFLSASLWEFFNTYRLDAFVDWGGLVDIGVVLVVFTLLLWSLFHLLFLVIDEWFPMKHSLLVLLVSSVLFIILLVNLPWQDTSDPVLAVVNGYLLLAWAVISLRMLFRPTANSR